PRSRRQSFDRHNCNELGLSSQRQRLAGRICFQSMSLGDRRESAISEDANWTEEQWLRLLTDLVDAGIVTWGEVASVTLGELNPPQVGTAIASKPSFQCHYPKR